MKTNNACASKLPPKPQSVRAGGFLIPRKVKLISYDSILYAVIRPNLYILYVCTTKRRNYPSDRT